MSIKLMDEDIIAGICIEIGAERDRQITEKGYDYAHDKLFNNTDDLANKAAHFAASTIPYGVFPDHQPEKADDEVLTPLYGFAGTDKDTKHKHDRRSQLIIAAALIIAEIERIDTDGFTMPRQ